MYVDAYFDRKRDMLQVIERVNGKREFKEFTPDYHFFVEDKYGPHLSIYRTPVKKIQPKSFYDRKRLVETHSGRLYESDANPIFRMLEQNYASGTIPTLNVAFFDIETDFDKENGYSSPADAVNAVTAISIYLAWVGEVICLSIPPKTHALDEAKAIAAEVGDTVIYENETDMLNAFIDIVEDADVLSGWNSDFYDVPYLVNRIIRILGKETTKKLSPWGLEPDEQKIVRGGRESQSYEIPGKLSMDYMELYKKYNFEERHSYALDSIAEIELGERKVEYEGTLDDLYNNDYKKFLEYSLQDSMLLHRLDKKLGYIDLCNMYAHSNCVLLPTVMGTVALVDQAITIEAHSRGMVVPARVRQLGDVRAAGGWVATPDKGLHKWVGSADLTSLYPSVIRALNMSPETIVGQIDLSRTADAIRDFIEEAKSHSFAEWWNDRFVPLELEPYFNNIQDETLTLRMETGEVVDLTVKELRMLLDDSDMPWMLSANGTIFHYEYEGVIPGLLTRWFTERKQLQRIMRMYAALGKLSGNEGTVSPSGLIYEDVKVDSGRMFDPHEQDQVFNMDRLTTLISSDMHEANDYLARCNIREDEGKLVYKDLDDLPSIVGFWNKRQEIRKLSLNSTYGALLNAGSRFFDQRLGQSTTLTGRNITRHMAAKTNEVITGVYDHYGEACIYGDTDSVYYSAYKPWKEKIESGEIPWDKDTIIELYDAISSGVSETFPKFLEDTFNIPIERSTGVIRADREVVADTALFIKKKRYAARVIDDEGARKDINGEKGKMKIMGLDLRRSDTPVIVQDFLRTILISTLDDQSEDFVISQIREFKQEFAKIDAWNMGSPKAVNNLTSYGIRLAEANEERARGNNVKLSVPGHVSASMNWNTLRELNKDWNSPPIIDGQKVIVCKMKKKNIYNYTSVAYPVDITHMPDWFTSLPFDEEEMMAGIVDKKVENLLGVLGWDLSKTSKERVHLEQFFKFD